MTKKKQILPIEIPGLQAPEPKDIKRYFADIEGDWIIGTLEEIKEWVIDNYDIYKEIELTEVVGKTKKTKLNISLKF